ncbi:MAG: hypothetical protein LJE64_01515 [Desulfofustis sp.]|nr:hypothetical protein [Desulfofustis sp.]
MISAVHATCCHRLSTVLGVMITVHLLMNSPPFVAAQAQDAAEQEETFANVEERRLQVRIIEAYDQIDRDKKALLLKEKELQRLREEIDLKLEELDRKLAQLAREKATLSEMRIGESDAAEDPLAGLSSIYENMDPVKAALALADLEPETAAAILAGMRSRSAAKILDILNSRKASELTEILSTLPR